MHVVQVNGLVTEEAFMAGEPNTDATAAADAPTPAVVHPNMHPDRLKTTGWEPGAHTDANGPMTPQAQRYLAAIGIGFTPETPEIL
jgi:hypothetical protein